MSYRSVWALAGSGFALFLTVASWGHVDDLKERARHVPYDGPGWRSADGGVAAIGFDASGVTMLSWVSLFEFGGGGGILGNDCWGYTSPSGREYALMGLSSGTGFVEITDPSDPEVIAVMSGPNSTWRDIKVYLDHAYVVTEGGSGIQVFDLSNIDDTKPGSRVNFVGAGFKGPGTESTHNVAIDTDTGHLFRCGGGSNGLRIYDLVNPSEPQYIGEWQSRYVHDAQIVVWDSGKYKGDQIAFCCAGLNGGSVLSGLTILNLTQGKQLAHVTYAGNAYSHQGWLSEDRQYFYLNDELDELPLTRVMDVSDLDNPAEVATFTTGSTSIDHNLYVRGGHILQANYRSGLRVHDAGHNPLAPVHVGYFDSYPDDDSGAPLAFNGMWSNYPFFPSDTVIGSDMELGLFVLRVGPENNDCENATTIGNGLHAFSNHGADTDGPVAGACGLDPDPVHDAWFAYLPRCDGTLTLSTCLLDGGSADFDTALALYEADNCDDLTLVACNNDSLLCPAGGSTISFEVTGNQRYLVRVGGAMPGALGSGELFLDGPVPACTADLDCDGQVGQSDLGILLSCFANQAPCGDVDLDGDTDQADLGELLAQFGNTCP